MGKDGRRRQHFKPSHPHPLGKKISLYVNYIHAVVPRWSFPSNSGKKRDPHCSPSGAKVTASDSRVQFSAFPPPPMSVDEIKWEGRAAAPFPARLTPPNH